MFTVPCEHVWTMNMGTYRYDDLRHTVDTLPRDGRQVTAGASSTAHNGHWRRTARFEGDLEVWGTMRFEGERGLRESEVWGTARFEGDLEVWGTTRFEGEKGLRERGVWGTARFEGELEVWGNNGWGREGLDLGRTMVEATKVEGERG